MAGDGVRPQEHTCEMVQWQWQWGVGVIGTVEVQMTGVMRANDGGSEGANEDNKSAGNRDSRA